jgi:benzoyl-CoA reductase/2-hydroxyglutaryl-CoA dehydratase subunit BcrC/BadD/HgdB
LTAFETMQWHYQQRDLAAKEWKRKGGKIVGYFCDSVPEELILAAGFFPLRITGDPHGGTEEIDKYLEPFYEGFVRTQLNMILTGKYDFLDFMIIPRTRDSITQQYSHLHQIKALNPVVKLPRLYYFEQLATMSYASQSYNLDRVRDLKENLEEWSGKEISNQSLSQAIAITNENRKLLKKLAELRAGEPPRISGVESLQIIGSSMFMLKEDHNKLLKQFLEEADKLPARDGLRLFVEASPLDNLQLYEIIESCKATVVAEDNCWGNRYSDDLIDTSRSAVEAIASRYHLKSPCPYVPKIGPRAEYCLKKAIEAKAQGVIFYILDWDPSQLWDYPEQNRVLENKSIPTVSFIQQKYLISEPGLLKAGIEKFVESIRANR